MTPNYPLSAELLDAIAPEQKDQCVASDSLELSLQAFWKELCQAFPSLNSQSASFFCHLGQRLPPQRPLEKALETIWVRDLALAWACLQNHTPALLVFDHQCLLPATQSLHYLHPTDAELNEVRQSLRFSLLAADEDRPPKLASYRGQAPLRVWVKTSAANLLLNLRRSARKQASDQELDLVAATDDGDQETAYIKSLYEKDFKAAFQEALASLSPRERVLLKYYYLDGIQLEQIGTLYQVHRATAARWIERIRTRLRSLTRETLAKRLRLTSEAEITSLERVLVDQFEASLQRVLHHEEKTAT